MELTSTIQVHGSTASPGNGGGGGLSVSEKIALGVGIAFVVPATITAVITCLRRQTSESCACKAHFRQVGEQ